MEERDGLKSPDAVTFAADCIKAYYQADQIEEVCVAPPAEYLAARAALGLRTDVLWYLKKMLPGQRTGGAAWIATAKSRLETRGYERNQASPQFYFHRAKRVLLELHMDDIHGVGPSKEAGEELLALRSMFDLKSTDTIMTGKYSHLKRERLRRGGETMVRANPAHIKNLIELLGMEKAKPCPSPSLVGTMLEDLSLLEGEEIATYRRAVGIALYLGPDRWDIQRDVQLLSRKLQSPTKHDWKRLVKVVRYLKGTQQYGVRLARPLHARRDVIKLDLFSDTDFAGCAETRRAMTCGLIFLDGQPVHGFARRQGVQSTSSGEAELYGASSVVFDGRLVKGLLEWLDFKVDYTLHVDSSSAKAMMNRDGDGGVKHLDVRVLWLQQERGQFGLKVHKVAGERNPADLGTKAHGVARFLALREMSGVVECPEMDDWPSASVTTIEAQTKFWGAPANGARLLAKLSLLSMVGNAAGMETSAAASSPSTTSTFVGLAMEGVWIMMMMLFCIVLVLAAVKLWPQPRERPERGLAVAPIREVRNVATQSQVTYARNRIVPRFVPLGEYQHGGWVM